MPVGWRGFYINLDRSADRREAMARNLAQAGIADAYARFPAVDGTGKPAGCRLKPGEYGCFRSHHDLIAGLAADGRFIHVMEDDAVLSRVFTPAIQAIIGGGLMDGFDIVLTDMMVTGDLGFIQMLKALYDRNAAPGKPLSFAMMDLKDTNFSVMSSYFVNPRAVGRVSESLARGLANGPNRPVDLFLCDDVKAGRLKAGLLFPFLTTVDATLPSTVAVKDASIMASFFLRNAFYVEADIPARRRQMSELMRAIGPAPGDDRLDLIADVLRFMVSDRFRAF